MSAREGLARFAVFAGLPDACVRAIEAASDVETFPAGHVFFQAGEGGAGLFLLEEGAVQTFRTSGVKKLIIGNLQAPAVFGEMGCVGACLYHCCAQAVVGCRVRVIRQAAVPAILEACPGALRGLLDLVSERFVGVLMDLDATAFRQLIPRLAGLLLVRAEGDRVENLTHREIAEHLRVYRESATAALGELRKARIIAVGRKQIQILDRARLERAARESG